MSWSRWLGMGAAAGLIAALAPVIQGGTELDESLMGGTALSKAVLSPEDRGKKAAPVDLRGLDLLRLDVRPGRVTSPLPGGRTAELTLDPVVQRAAERVMRKYRVPEAGVVAIAPKTGEVLAYASHVAEGDKFDVNIRSEAPAASVFKVVTGAALIEKADIGEKTEQCYRGGRSRILASELEDDPERDKWCATVGIAMGRSLNVVFGRLAKKHLMPEDLAEMGGALGFGAPVPFAVENEAPLIDIPEQPLEFARTAAGFWNTSLSPLAGASLVQTIANGGVTLRPRIVRAVLRGKEEIARPSDEAVVVRRAMKKETADELTKMMEHTVSGGSAYKTFHDRRGNAFLPNIKVAGKTGTLTRHEENRHYTWLVAFAPADDPEIAVAALVVNTPRWRIKGPHLAREVMRAYFAERGRPGVSAP